jgi:hypothetical protein
MVILSSLYFKFLRKYNLFAVIARIQKSKPSSGRKPLCMLAAFLPITSSSHFNIFYLIVDKICLKSHRSYLLLKQPYFNISTPFDTDTSSLLSEIN